MELSDFESFHYLYRALWQDGEGEAIRYQINMMDTIIFQHGTPFRWLFTSEQTGEILKKKNCKVTPTEIVTSLKKRAGKLRGKKISHRDRTKFASVWYRDTMGRLIFRLLDETELYFLLGDRTYTQLISAIQVFFNGLPFKGSGVFEHNFLNVSSLPPTANNYRTFELLSPPPSIDMIEFGNQTLTSDYHGQNNSLHNQTQTSLIDWKGNINETDQINLYPNTNEKILVNSAHEEILRVKTNQIIKLLEHVIQSKILKISLIYFFNTSLIPFVVSCERVVIEPKGFNTIPSSLEITTAGAGGGGGAGAAAPKDEITEKLKKIELDERNAMLTKFQIEPKRGMRINYNRMDSEVEVIGVLPSKKQFHSTSGAVPSSSSPSTNPHSHSHPKPLLRSASDIYGTPQDEQIKKEIAKEIRKNSQLTIPSVQTINNHNTNNDNTDNELLGEGLENIYQERIPNRTELRSKFGGKRMTMLGNFISLGPNHNTGLTKDQPKSPTTNNSPTNNNHNLTSTILSHYKIGINSERYPKNSIKSKHYAQHTDSYTYRIKAYSDRIKGSTGDPTTTKKSLQSMSRVHSSKSQAFMSQDIMGDYQGVHGVDVGGIRASGLVKKLSLQGHTCWGDYCNLLSSLHASPDDTKEYLQSIGMIKITTVDGTIRIKSTRTELNQITCKSILLARTESKYIGGELSVMENIESYEYLEGDVLNACAHQHVQKVAEKCRKEAFTSLVHSGLKSIPSMSDLQAVAYTYRNMVYNDALAQVHPARFYLTVPACRICVQLYTALDRCREEYIYRPSTDDPVIRAMVKGDEGDISADIVQKTRRVLKAKANHYRSLQNNEDQDVSESQQELDNSLSRDHLLSTTREECDYDEDDELEHHQQQQHYQHHQQHRQQEEQEGEEDEYGEKREDLEEKPHTMKIMSPSQMVMNKSALNQNEIQRRKSQLLQGHHLGGTGNVQNPDNDHTSPRKIIQQISGNRSNGSFPVWVDLMVAANSSKDLNSSNNKHEIKKFEDKKEKILSPEVLERRKSIQMLRKVDKMDWRMMLRDESISKQFIRPKSANAINSKQRDHLLNSSHRSYQKERERTSPMNQQQQPQHQPQQQQHSLTTSHAWDMYGDISFTQAPYLPYRPHLEQNLQTKQSQQSQQSQQEQEQQEERKIKTNKEMNLLSNEEELFFLYSPPTTTTPIPPPSHASQTHTHPFTPATVTAATHSSKLFTKIPKVLPIPGTIADKKYHQ